MRTTIIIYGILIGALTGYWYYLSQDCRVSEQILELLGKIQTDNNKILRRFAEGCYGEINNLSYQYITTETIFYNTQAEKIHALTKDIGTSNTDSLAFLYAALLNTTQPWLRSRPQFADLWRKEALTQSALSKHYPSIAEYQRAHIYLLKGTALQQWRDSARAKEAQYWDFMPIVVSSDKCLQPRDTCAMVVYDCAYLCQSDHLEMYINGHPIPVERGIGRWTTTFNKTGEVNIETEIRRKNPVTGEIQSYSKTVTRSICPNKLK